MQHYLIKVNENFDFRVGNHVTGRSGRGAGERSEGEHEKIYKFSEARW